MNVELPCPIGLSNLFVMVLDGKPGLMSSVNVLVGDSWTRMLYLLALLVC